MPKLPKLQVGYPGTHKFKDQKAKQQVALREQTASFFPL